MRAGYHPSDKPAKDTLKERGFYHTPAWRRMRKAALLRDHYMCQLRVSEKCTGIATEVHHVKPLEACPELALDIGNLTSVCWYCHEETKERKDNTPTITGNRSVRVIRISAKTDEDLKL